MAVPSWMMFKRAELVEPGTWIDMPDRHGVSDSPAYGALHAEALRVMRRRLERLDAEALRYLVACVPLDELVIIDIPGRDEHVMHVSQVDGYVRNETGRR